MNRSGRVRLLLLGLVTGGLLFLLALGFLVRSCTDSFRSADPEQKGRPAAADPVSQPPRTPVRSLRPVGTAPTSAFQVPKLEGVSVPKLERGLIEQPDLAPSVDAGTAGGSPVLTDEEVRAAEVRRSQADRDKLKLLQRRR